jgi:hypothetical protein
MALPVSLLVHTATPLEYDEPQSSPAAWIEGEPGAAGGGEPVQGAPFPCVLFLPGGGGDQPNQYRRRVVEQPTMLYNVTREDGTTVTLDLESDLLVTAPELEPWTGAETARWTLVGDPQPFGPPGTVIGAQAVLRMVRD